jgi:hypothetical protein
MKTSLAINAFVAVIASLATIAAIAAEPERRMGVRAGPERVFGRPVAEIVPQLQGATATDVNGRVGAELVFWGYRLGSGGATNLFGCAMVEGVDCEARTRQICPDGEGRIQQSAVEPGNIIRRECAAVGNAAVGELHPGCINNEIQHDVLVGLVNCPGN